MPAGWGGEGAGVQVDSSNEAVIVVGALERQPPRPPTAGADLDHLTVSDWKNRTGKIGRGIVFRTRKAYPGHVYPMNNTHVTGFFLASQPPSLSLRLIAPGFGGVGGGECRA